MDILGFVAILAFFGVIAPRMGLDHAMMDTLRLAWSQGIEFYDQARLQYHRLVVSRTKWMLGISFCMQSGLLLFGYWLASKSFAQMQGVDAYVNVFLLGSILFLAAHVADWWYIRNSDPRFRVHPLTDEFGNNVDENGVLMPDGLETLVDELVVYPGYLPERFSLIRSLTVVLGGLLWIGCGIGFLGIHGRNSQLFAVGALSVYAALSVLILMSSAIAWGVDKGTKLGEFIATVVSKEVLVALPHIKWSNIESYLPKGVDVLDEERAAAVIRGIFRKVAIELIPFVIIVWVFTHPLVALIASSLFIVTAGLGLYYAFNGGADAVAQQKKRFAGILYFTMTIVSFAALCWQKVVQPGSTVGFVLGVDHKPWHNFLALVICLLGLFLFGTITAITKPGEKAGSVSKVSSLVLYAITGLCLIGVGWNGYSLIRNIRHQGDIPLTVTKPAIPSASANPAPAAPPTALAVTAPKPAAAASAPSAPATAPATKEAAAVKLVASPPPPPDRLATNDGALRSGRSDSAFAKRFGSLPSVNNRIGNTAE